MCDTGLRNIRTLICPVPYLRSNLGVGNRMGGPRLEVVVLPCIQPWETTSTCTLGRYKND